MAFVIGGPTAWKVRDFGDYAVAYHFIDTGQGEGHQPTLCMFPTRKPLGCVPYCIQLRDAYRFLESTGYATKSLIEESVKKAAACMCVSDDRPTLFRIADVLVSAVQDLLLMPEYEMHKRQLEALKAPEVQVGEADITVDGEVIQQRPVTIPEDPLVIEPVRLH